MICGLWSLWLLKMVKQNHRAVQDSEHSMLQRSTKWTVDGEDVKMIIEKTRAKDIPKLSSQKQERNAIKW